MVVAIFAVINVDTVTVDYLFGTAHWPLVIVILGSALLGALVVGGVGIYRMIRLQMENRRLKKRNGELNAELEKLNRKHELKDDPARETTGENHTGPDDQEQWKNETSDSR
ncbi:MAG TPA: lipopolysaccharide assembly protein LapA domain-containing protein [Bacillales bacterium]|nr:lipopolysaccharide assembly protein LapA domain-containing protein [Bacillales bacterium]